MEQLKFKLPNLKYKSLLFNESHNVGFEGRADEYEKQNKLYKKVGYTEHNSRYRQTFEVGNDVYNFGKTLFDNCTISIMCQLPGQTLPMHTDTFYTFATKNNVDPKDCLRINIFLEDWKNGHYLEIDNIPVVKWKKGDAVLIHAGQPHLSGNMGMCSKYTMQITGIKDEFKRS
jgi:quercetin dioxygenase-like cupin family protein